MGGKESTLKVRKRSLFEFHTGLSMVQQQLVLQELCYRGRKREHRDQKDHTYPEGRTQKHDQRAEAVEIELNSRDYIVDIAGIGPLNWVQHFRIR